jgi:Domain of unknown function (DUF6458)
MTLGLSLFAIAVGAILKFAVEASVGGIDIGTVGVILMIVGAVGLVVSMGAPGARKAIEWLRRGARGDYWR